MTWDIDWGPVFRKDLLRMHWRIGGRLCAEILRFAETGRSPHVIRFPESPRQLKVLVPGAIAYMVADHREGVLYVERAFVRAH